MVCSIDAFRTGQQHPEQALRLLRQDLGSSLCHHRHRLYGHALLPGSNIDWLR
jgi:hypothetical protein